MKNKRLDTEKVRKRLMLPKTIALHDDRLDVVFVRRQFKMVIDAQPHSSASYVLKRGRKTSPFYEITVHKSFTNLWTYNGDNLAVRSWQFTYRTDIEIMLHHRSTDHDRFPEWSAGFYGYLMSDECLERTILKMFKVLVPKLKRQIKRTTIRFTSRFTRRRRSSTKCRRSSMNYVCLRDSRWILS